MRDDIVRDQGFHEVADARLDAKHRISLGKIGHAARQYKIYENALGQIILDPLVAVPASELWLYKNKKALTQVRKGLVQAAAGRLVRRPSYAKHAADKLD